MILPIIINRWHILMVVVMITYIAILFVYEDTAVSQEKAVKQIYLSSNLKKKGLVEVREGIAFVKIPAGSFMQGGNKVKVNGFWMAMCEVTQQQYESIMGINPSYFKGNPDNPVERVNWYNAVEFCNKLSIKAGCKPYYTIDKVHKDPENKNTGDTIKWTVTINGGNGFRLPESAEWEYACRAGTTTRYYWGDNVNGDYCWYNANSDEQTHPVGTKLPNAWGLYDMSGNVWEWCFDWDIDDYGVFRIIRGGSWNYDADLMESSVCNYGYPNDTFRILGFRPVRNL